MRSHLDFLY
jgi:hypothetical protein